MYSTYVMVHGSQKQVKLTLSLAWFERMMKIWVCRLTSDGDSCWTSMAACIGQDSISLLLFTHKSVTIMYREMSVPQAHSFISSNHRSHLHRICRLDWDNSGNVFTAEWLNVKAIANGACFWWMHLQRPTTVMLCAEQSQWSWQEWMDGHRRCCNNWRIGSYAAGRQI